MRCLSYLDWLCMQAGHSTSQKNHIAPQVLIAHVREILGCRLRSPCTMLHYTEMFWVGAFAQ